MKNSDFKTKRIVYLVPAYNEEESVNEFYKVWQETVGKLKDQYSFSLLFVDDGSTDRTLELLDELHLKEENVGYIALSRNRGHQNALWAGLNYIKENDLADAVIIMDADLQDPPYVSLQFIEKWEEGYDVVYGVRKTRKDNMLKKLTARVFYRILFTFATLKIPRDTGDFRLVDRKVLSALTQINEKNKYVRGLVAYVGFKQFGLEFHREGRFAGVTHYPFSKMFTLAMNALFAFVTFPFHHFITFAIIELALILGYVIYAMTNGLDLTNFISFMLIVNLPIIVGLLGLIGAYIGRIHDEVLDRPLYFIATEKPPKKSKG